VLKRIYGERERERERVKGDRLTQVRLWEWPLNRRMCVCVGWCESVHEVPQRTSRHAASCSTLVRLRLVKVSRDVTSQPT